MTFHFVGQQKDTERQTDRQRIHKKDTKNRGKEKT